MIRFGSAGLEEKYKTYSTIDAPKLIKGLGLSAFEYSFGHGYMMGSETATAIGKSFKEEDVKLSFHAPYFINLANPNDEMGKKSASYIITGMKFLEWSGAERLVVHLGSCGKGTREEGVKLISRRLDDLLEELYKTDLLRGKFICPETMGKSLQIGTFEEIIDFCTKDTRLLPTFDFGHINAYTGGRLKTKDDFKRIFDYSFKNLGEERTKNCHIHFSKIEFGAKGEIKHLTLEDTIYGPEFFPLAEVLHEYKLTPDIICESRDKMAEDAALLKKIYECCKCI